jgi:hypothetical protein
MRATTATLLAAMTCGWPLGASAGPSSTVEGVVSAFEHHGTGYVEIAVKVPGETGANKLWVSSGRTQCYRGGQPGPGSCVPDVGERIRAEGEWIESEGELMLWAERIDLPVSTQADGALRIGVLNNASMPGCGCTFTPVRAERQFPEKYLFISDAEGRAYMNLDGRDTALREVGRKQAPGEYGYCAGSRCTFAADSITATVDFLEVERCPPEPTECEVTGYEVTITVERDGMKERVKGKGECGC